VDEVSEFESMRRDFGRKLEQSMRTLNRERERKLKRSLEWAERAPFPADLRIHLEPSLPEGMVLAVPRRDPAEDRDHWLKRCVLIKNVGTP
jgi:hypothetical protein